MQARFRNFTKPRYTRHPSPVTRHPYYLYYCNDFRGEDYRKRSMGKKKRTAEALEDGNIESRVASMPSHNGTLSTFTPQVSDGRNNPIESYLVKKYKPATFYRSIDEFQKYTKTHRMLDASFVRVLPAGRGATPDKPHVFSVRISNSDLSWGRGRTRDSAIDAAIRAAFFLMASHGHNEFEMDEDCMTTEPAQIMIVPAPPPPPSMPMILPMATGMASMPPGFPPPLPPLPPGSAPLPPPLPPTGSVPLPPFPIGLMPPPLPPQEDAHLIPQPKLPTMTVRETTQINPNQGFSLEAGEKSTKNKTGPTLVYDGGINEGDNEFKFISMEEKRAICSRYKAMVHKAVVNRLAFAPTK